MASAGFTVGLATVYSSDPAEDANQLASRAAPTQRVGLLAALNARMVALVPTIRGFVASAERARARAS